MKWKLLNILVLCAKNGLRVKYGLQYGLCSNEMRGSFKISFQ